MEPLWSDMSFDDILQNVELALVKVIPSGKKYSEVQKQNARKLVSKICEDCDAQEQDYIKLFLQKYFFYSNYWNVTMWVSLKAKS